MTTEIAAPDAPLPVVDAGHNGSDHGSMIALIARAAAEPSVDIAKMQALWAMQIQIETRQAARDFADALNRAQAEISPVVRTTENTQTRSFFARLEDVDRAIRPIYVRHGFALSFNTVAPLVEGHIRIECLCSHRGGHTERYGREAPADTLGPKGSAVKTQLHGGASTETFLKRYITCGIFNVVFVGADDDGNKGGAEYIDGETVKEIDMLLRETKSDLARFLHFMKADSIPQITVFDLPRGMNMLLAKKRKMENEANPEGEGEEAR